MTKLYVQYLIYKDEQYSAVRRAVTDIVPTREAALAPPDAYAFCYNGDCSAFGGKYFIDAEVVTMADAFDATGGQLSERLQTLRFQGCTHAVYTRTGQFEPYYQGKDDRVDTH